MIGGVLTLAERSVASIMTPRSQISWININETPEKFVNRYCLSHTACFPFAEVVWIKS
jgi:CBS domain containing-hemolysin-like protein